MARGTGGRSGLTTSDRPRTPGKSIVGATRRWLAVFAILVRIDARRPASWIAAAACLLAGVMAATAPLTAVLPLVIVCGGLGAVAAVGAVDPGDDSQGRRWPGAPRGGEERAVWAAAGALVAAVACRSTTPIGIAGTAMLTGLAMHVARRRGLAPADVASIALGICLAAAGACVLAPQSAGVAAAAGGWLGACALLLWWPRWHGIDDITGGAWRTDVETASGSPLAWLAMISLLAAMAACYFLAPEHAVWYAVLAAGWLVCLAAPAATIAGGAHDVVSRSMLVASAPGRPAVPGTSSHALAIVATQVAILAWPAAVAAVLWGSAAMRPDGPLTALMVLASLGALTAGIAAPAVRRGHGETALAIIAALAMAGATLVFRRAIGGDPASPW